MISTVTSAFLFCFITFDSRKRHFFFFFSLSYWPLPSEFTALWQAPTWLYADTIYLCTQLDCVRVSVSVLLSHCLTSFNSTHIFLITVWNSPEFPCCENWKADIKLLQPSSEKEIAHLYGWDTWKDTHGRFLSKTLHTHNLKVRDSDTAPHVGHLLPN